MNLIFQAALILMFSFLTSCQVKDGTGSEELISGHAPTTNKFSVQPPAGKTYVSGDTLTFGLSFPYNVLVNTTGGTPRLSIDVGGVTRYATLQSGAGTKNLSFSYVVTGTDNDADGINLNGLELNGGTLTFLNNGDILNCDISTVSSIPLSSLQIDNTAPTITAGIFTNLVPPPPPSKYYRVGDKIIIALTFSEPVFVTGNPVIEMIIDRTIAGTNAPVLAEYAGGSGTSTLNFIYTVNKNDRETVGTINVSPAVTFSPVGGTIKDRSGIDAVLDLGAVESTLESLSSGIKFNGRMPYVQNIIVPTPKSYYAGETIDFILEFDRRIVVTHTPPNDLKLVLRVGPGTNLTSRNADFISATDTTMLFRYTLVPGDEDSDGISFLDELNMGTAIIRSFDSTETADRFVNTVSGVRNHALVVPDMSGVIFTAVQPMITAASILPDTSGAYGIGTTPDNYFKIGEDIFIILNFNDSITVNQNLGTPRIRIDIGGVTRYAPYLSGSGQTSLIFKYTVLEGDSDTNGITLDPTLELNGATLTNAANTNSLTTIPTTSFPDRMVDGIRPTISTFGVPAPGTYSRLTNPVKNQLNFPVTWSEAVRITNTVNVPLIIGSTARNATWQSGTDATVTNFRYLVQNGETDTDGITVSSPLVIGTGSIYDSHGNSPLDLTYTVPPTSAILVDNTAPTITNFFISSSPTPRHYRVGEIVQFQADFSEPVTVTTTGGVPYVRMTIGSTVRNVPMTTTGTASSHTFSYAVVASDEDIDHPEFTALTVTIPTNSSIRDEGGNPSSLNFSSPDMTNIIIDEIGPTITSGATVAGTYVSASEGTNRISITLTLKEPVNITGTPSIDLGIATGTVSAQFNNAPSPLTSLVFNYDVVSTDMDLDGLTLASANLNLNGGTITDLRGNAQTNFAIGSVTNLSNVFVAPMAVVWIKSTGGNVSGFTTRPVVTAIPTVMDGSYRVFNGTSDTLAFTNPGSVTMRALYMAIKTPASVLGDKVLVNGSHFVLRNENIDILSNNRPAIATSYPYSYNPGGLGLSSTYPSCLHFPSASEWIEIYFDNNTAIPINPLTASSYNGGIGEVLIFTNTLSTNQRNHIKSYLGSKFP